MVKLTLIGDIEKLVYDFHCKSGFCFQDSPERVKFLGNDSFPESLDNLVMGFSRTGINPTFGISMTSLLKVVELSLKSQNNALVLESVFFMTGQLNV